MVVCSCCYDPVVYPDGDFSWFETITIPDCVPVMYGKPDRVHGLPIRVGHGELQKLGMTFRTGSGKKYQRWHLPECEVISEKSLAEVR